MPRSVSSLPSRTSRNGSSWSPTFFGGALPLSSALMGRPHQQHSGKAEALLLAAGKALSPVALLVELVDEVGQADRLQRRFQLAAARLVVELGIGDRIGERAERQVGALRQK